MNLVRMAILRDALRVAKPLKLQHSPKSFKYTAQQVEALGFNMDYFLTASTISPDRTGHDCKSVGCIGGWACALFAEVPEMSCSQAKIELDLTDEQARILFLPDDSSMDYDKVTPQVAAEAVQQMMDTGTVNWTKLAPRDPIV